MSTPCTSLAAPSIPDANVIQMSTALVDNFTYTQPGSGSVYNLDFCNVSLALTHPGDRDHVYITVWLPIEQNWNGRYQATGGSGLAAGGGDKSLYDPVAAGYVASSTDGGLTLDNTVDPQAGTWAINDDGSPNKALLLNLAWRSIHDMAVASKAIMSQFYGDGPSYSYWTGCSQGGRQGYAAAAKYPEDFDGILAVAPGVSEPEHAPADFWPPIVMQNMGDVPPFCVFEAYQQALLTACDPLDGVADGLISDYDILVNCPFDPMALVGSVISCPATDNIITITESHANIVSEILAGPRNPDRHRERLWYGLAPGASFSATAHTVVDDSEQDVWVVQPFVAAGNWIKYLALRNATYDLTKMTYRDFFEAFKASKARLSKYFGDEYLLDGLPAFQRAGGKLLTWVGLADQYIPPTGTLRFRSRVEEELFNGDVEAVDEFYRLFTAPGVGHCSGGTGPQPLNAFAALVDWVENGNPPDVLAAAVARGDGSGTVTRNLCRYPKKLVYQGGDVDQAASFVCA